MLGGSARLRRSYAVGLGDRGPFDGRLATAGFGSRLRRERELAERISAQAHAIAPLITAKLKTGCSVVVPPVVANVILKLPADTLVTWVM